MISAIITTASAEARGQLLLVNISSQTTRPIMMFSTALAPFGFGELFDWGVGVDTIAWGGAVYTVAGVALLQFANVRDRRRLAA